MQRPVMNPTFYENTQPAPKLRLIRWDVLFRGLRLMWRLMLIDPLTRRPRCFRNEDGTPLRRFLRGLLYRLAFVPIVMAIITVALVFSGTHPASTPATLDPSAVGVYFDPVSLLSEDGTGLEAWLVPAVDAKVVLAEKDLALKRKYPAVVLAHDFGSSRQDMLPLVKPLHDAGIVVLALNLRGLGAARPAGQTFGLNESLDIKAAVAMLANRAYVDPSHIGVVGVGSGATAALLAADADSRISALVLEDPITSYDDVIRRHITPRDRWLRWMQPLCKWTFEMAYKVDAENIDLANFKKLMQSRPTLLLDEHEIAGSLARKDQIKQVRLFLRKHLSPGAQLASGT